MFTKILEQTKTYYRTKFTKSDLIGDLMIFATLGACIVFGIG